MITAVLILSGMITASILAPVLVRYPPNELNMQMRLRPPSYEHPLGTDALGRDMLSRILYGGRASMVLALSTALLSMLLGLVLGVMAGWYGNALDWIFTTAANIFQGLPDTCLIVAIAGTLGPGIQNLLAAMIITSWAGFSRIVRAETLSLREEPYIESMRCFACNGPRMIMCHILPNIRNSVIILFTARIGRNILAISALSFLGLGVQPPTPDWSMMINDARMHYRSAPHLIIVPGICIFSLLLSLNMLGDALRDWFDVKNDEAPEL